MRISSPNLVPIERSSVAALGLIALAAVAAYANSLAGDFVWDDRILVLDGRLARASDRIVEILTSDFFRRAETDNAYGYYRPLTTLSYLWDYAWWRLDPFGYHFTNVCLHAVNCLLSFVFIRQLGMSARVALVAGLVFAVHPIHTENVAWIAGRTDLLAYLFVLVAMMLHLRPRLAWLAPIAFAAGLLAKEMAIVAVAWVFLVDLVGRRHSLQQALRATLPFLVVVAAYGFWRIVVIDVPGPGAPAAHTPAAVVAFQGGFGVEPAYGIPANPGGFLAVDSCPDARRSEAFPLGQRLEGGPQRCGVFGPEPVVHHHVAGGEFVDGRVIKGVCDGGGMPIGGAGQSGLVQAQRIGRW